MLAASCYVAEHLTGSIGISLSIAPFVIPAIAAGVGGLVNLFGGEEKKTYTVDDLVKYGYKPYDEGEELANLNRYTAAMQKNRRGDTNEKLASEGFSPAGSIYTNESDILDNQTQAAGQIKQTARNEKNKIAQMLFGLNEGQPEEQSGIMKFLSGAVGGARQGFTIADMLKQVPGGSAG